MKATDMLRDNVRTLLDKRKIDDKDLAKFLKIDPSWLSKLLNSEDRMDGLPMKHLNRMAEFFSIDPYVLLRPGISEVSERRSGHERRRGADRRIGRSSAMRAPVTMETLSPRLVELVRVVNELTVEKFDELFHWAQAQQVLQGLQPGGVFRADPKRKGREPRERSARKPPK